MRKQKFLFALVVVMALFMTACGRGNENNTTDNNQFMENQLEDTVTVYTTHSEEMLEAIGEAFTRKTGVEVNFINLKGELADRIRNEKENPQADVMFGGDEATFTLLQQEGCFEKTTPTWSDKIDDDYRDDRGYWYGTYRTPVVLFYNTSLLTKEEAPKDWSDLAKDSYKDMIVTRDPLSSSMRSTILALIEHHMDEEGNDAAWTYIEKLSNNTKNYYNSGSMMFQAIGKGEAAISWAVLNDVLKNKEENQMPLEYVIPLSGAVEILDCIAVTKNAPHPNAAAAFVEFVGSVDGQSLTAKQFKRMPVLEAALTDAPEWMKLGMETLDVDWEGISKNQSQWLDKWETDYVDADKQKE